jgi:hypothetical protein
MLLMSPVTPGSGGSVAYLEILVTGQEDTSNDVAVVPEAAVPIVRATRWEPG